MVKLWNFLGRSLHKLFSHLFTSYLIWYLLILHYVMNCNIMYMSIQILKTSVPETSHFNAHFYHLSAAVQLKMRTWKSNAANAIFASLFPRLVQTMPLINDLKAADSSIKGAIFGRYMQLPSLKQQPSYTFKGLLNDDVWRCVMMCDDSQKQELTSTDSSTAATVHEPLHFMIGLRQVDKEQRYSVASDEDAFSTIISL